MSKSESSWPACIALLLVTTLAALDAQSVNPAATVPRTVRYAGTFHPADGLPVQLVEGVTIAVYRDQAGGEPLWQETQNVQLDASGNFAVEMGATQNDGLPLDLLRSGEPRWVGVRVNRPSEAEKPRVQMLSVPYALLASDSETLGGLPASAYLLNPSAPVASGSTATLIASVAASTNAVRPRITAGATNYIGVFTNNTDLGNSVLYQNVGRIGLNTGNPLDYFHVTFNDASGGFTGYAVQNLGSGAASYSGTLFYDQNGALGQFQGFNNSTHEYRINNIASNGSINFMLGSVSKFQVQPTGDVNIAGSLRKGGMLFLHNLGIQNTSIGLNALQFNTTGSNNTASGASALFANTTGSSNTAIGSGALLDNTTGSTNTATGYGALQNNTTGNVNTASGVGALAANITGSDNTANGYSALGANISGGPNTAIGVFALTANINGSYNTASGDFALYSNTTGGSNTANGSAALQNNLSGNSNTASGYAALVANINGSANTAVGQNALQSNVTGSYNTAIGALAGGQLTTGSDNLMIGNQGTASDDHTIRVGDSQFKTFIAGIRGVTTGASNAVTVVIDSNGQLGTINSSRRFKEDIQDMGDASSNLLRLRPVTYRYKQPYADGSKPQDYGLIAEEVAEIYPDLVVKGIDGQIETVQYQKLTPMLLNELQRQAETIQLLQEQNSKLDKRLAALEALLSTKLLARQ